MDAATRFQPVREPDFNLEFSEFAAKLTYEDLPASAIAAARLNVYDTLACAIAGYHAAGVQEVLEVVRDWGGKEEASVLWTPLRVPAPQAAWINGIMAHACDYDDTHDKAILHGGISIIPAVIAAAESAGRPISGKEFYAAVAVGLELICRIGVATRIGLIQAGFIYSGLFAGLSAAAAAARALGMDTQGVINAIGIAYTQTAGTHQVTRDGAMTKRMQPGFGARAALTATALAQKGIRGAQSVFEGIDGLGRTYLQEELDSDILREGLGTRWHFEDLSYKVYPSCRMNHGAVDSALQIRAMDGFDLADVTEIRVYINGQGNQAVGTPLEVRRNPQNVVQAQFSICYNVACALIQGKVGLGDFTAEAIRRPEMLALAAKVTPLVDPKFEAEMGRGVTPARVEVVTPAKVFTYEVLHPKGHFAAPMSPAELRRKLDDCIAFSGFAPAGGDLFEQIVTGLEASSDVAADFRRLSQGIAG